MQIWLDGRPLQTAPPEAPDAREWNQVRLASADGRLTIRRWQEVPGYWHFSNTGLAYYTRPLLLCLPLLLLPAWLVLRRGLRPLRQIGQQIEGRDARDLRPLPDTPYRELAPVVEAVNRLMARLSQRLGREREFLVDAAHELKTPLAVIEANADRLLRAAPRRRPPAPARACTRACSASPTPCTSCCP